MDRAPEVLSPLSNRLAAHFLDWGSEILCDLDSAKYEETELETADDEGDDA